MRKNKKCLLPLLSVFNQFIPGKMEWVRKTTQVIRREWHCPAGNSSEQMDLPLYKYLIVFLIKGTQSNSVTCIQAGKEKSLSFNIKLAPFKFTPLREQQLREEGKKKLLSYRSVQGRAKKVSEKCNFSWVTWGAGAVYLPRRIRSYPAWSAVRAGRYLGFSLCWANRCLGGWPLSPSCDWPCPLLLP